MVCIGKEITEELECEPAKFYIKRYIRYKYAAKDRSDVAIAELPEPVIDKGILGSSLLAMILTGKYQDHLPLHRQKQIFARENIQIASSTIEGWTRQALEKLEPLYEQLVFQTKSQGYSQVDETPIKVLDSDKKDAPIKAIIECITLHWREPFYLIIVLPVVGSPLYRCLGTSKVISRQTAMLV